LRYGIARARSAFGRAGCGCCSIPRRIKASNQTAGAWVKESRADPSSKSDPRDMGRGQSPLCCAPIGSTRDDGQTRHRPSHLGMNSLLRHPPMPRGKSSQGLYTQAQRTDGSQYTPRRFPISRRIFAGDEAGFAGWVEVQWAKPSGAALDKIVEQIESAQAHNAQQPAKRRSCRRQLLLHGRNGG